MNAIDELQKNLPMPDCASIQTGDGGLPKLVVETQQSMAEIYLHGAHVTHFQKHGEEPLLFLSAKSRFGSDYAIRGGVPIIFPWFGDREGHRAHGFARLNDWTLNEVRQQVDGSVLIRFRLPEYAFHGDYRGLQCEYIIRVSDTLRLQMNVWDESKEHTLKFESCFHTYFHVGDINSVSVAGLKYTSYLDKTDNYEEKFERSGQIRINGEVDRIYLDTAADTQIIDPSLNRRILIEKQGSASTVLWNPWIDRSQEIADLNGDDYKKFVCVESGNVNQNKIRLVPGETSTTYLWLSTKPLQNEAPAD